jgi:hypothetical protein
VVASLDLRDLVLDRTGHRVAGASGEPHLIVAGIGFRCGAGSFSTSGARRGSSARSARRRVGRAALLRPHPRELAQLVLVPATRRRLVEHRVELRRVHGRHLVVDPFLAEPLRDVEDRDAATLDHQEGRCTSPRPAADRTPRPQFRSHRSASTEQGPAVRHAFDFVLACRLEGESTACYEILDGLGHKYLRGLCQGCDSDSPRRGNREAVPPALRTHACDQRATNEPVSGAPWSPRLTAPACARQTPRRVSRFEAPAALVA